jgi:hypothetical protein
VSPSTRVRLTEIALAAMFAAAAAWLFTEGDARDGSLPLFLAWIVVHVLYGLSSGSLAALLIAITCPPLFVAARSGDWLDALFVELFYGVAFVFTGVVARRVWEGRRHPELPDEPGREDTAA